MSPSRVILRLCWLLMALELAVTQCPSNFAYINSQCVQLATTCNTPYVLQNGICMAPNAQPCGNGQIFVNGGCASIIINLCPVGFTAGCNVQPQTPLSPCPMQPVAPYPPAQVPTSPCPNQPVAPFPPVQPPVSPCPNFPVSPYPPSQIPPTTPSSPCPIQPVAPYPPAQVPTLPCPNQPVAPFPPVQPPVSPCPNFPVTPYPPSQILTTTPSSPIPLEPVAPYPPVQVPPSPCPNQPVTPFPPVQPPVNPCPGLPVNPYPPSGIPPTTPSSPIPLEPVAPYPPVQVTPSPCPSLPVTPFPPVQPPVDPCPGLPVNPYPPSEIPPTTWPTNPTTTPSSSTNTTTSTTTTTTPSPTTTSTTTPSSSTNTTTSTTTTTTPSPTTTSTPPPAPLIRCPEGTVLINGYCRLVYCSSGIYSSGHCVQPFCPYGTVWTGLKCASPIPTDIGPIHLEKTIITKKQENGPDLMINNVNNLVVNASISLTQSEPLDEDYEEEEEEEEEEETATPPTKCCKVFAPRLCRCQGESSRWQCSSRSQQRCGAFCSASKVVLKPPNVNSWYDDDDEMLVMPPDWDQGSCRAQRNCQEAANYYDCSGCATGRVESCSSYCYKYSCSSHSCAFYDQEQFCAEHVGQVGCRPEDGYIVPSERR